MPSVLSTGTNALLAFQRALATTSHNVVAAAQAMPYISPKRA